MLGGDNEAPVEKYVRKQYNAYPYDEAVRCGYMNFNLHFNLYKQELCDKVSNNNLDQIEMAILEGKKDNQGVSKIV